MCQHRWKESHLFDSAVIGATYLVLSLLPSPCLGSVSRAAVQFGVMFLVCEPL